jgi:hypothetical protein
VRQEREKGNNYLMNPSNWSAIAHPKYFDSFNPHNKMRSILLLFPCADKEIEIVQKLFKETQMHRRWESQDLSLRFRKKLVPSSTLQISFPFVWQYRGGVMFKLRTSYVLGRHSLPLESLHQFSRFL